MVIERPSTDTDDEVVTSARDGVGWIVLNRPRAINALTTGMIEQIDAALDRWEHDGSVRVIVLAGAGEREGFRATSLETLRQMVAAGVGMTLLPMLAVQTPVPASPDVALLPFAGEPPHRRIAMGWRRSSASRR